MRTTVTLDPDIEQIILRRMRERGMSLEEALNEAIRRGVTDLTSKGLFQTESASMGESTVNLDRALQVSADLEDMNGSGGCA